MENQMLKVKVMMFAAALAVSIAVLAPATASASYSVPYGSEALAGAIWNEAWAPEALVGGNNFSCKPSSAHPYPVVLVHGTFGDEGSNWITLGPLLANEGYCVYGFNFGATILSLPVWPFIGPRIDGLNHIENSAEELSSFVNRVLSSTKKSKVDLVGWSQGGLMPNYYIKDLGGGSKVNDFVALDPTNHGTTVSGITTLIEVFPFANDIIGTLAEYIGVPAAPEQYETSAFIHKLFGSGEPVVSGVNYTVIETTHDEAVTPYTNAWLNGSNVTNILIQNQCPSDPVAHVGSFDDSPMLQNVVNQLSSSPNPSFQATCTKYGQGI